MAISKCKGSFLKLSIASTLTAIPHLIGFQHQGAASKSFRSTALDTVGAYEQKEMTGYSDAGNISAELFYDPAGAPHQAITDLIKTPAKSVWQMGFADVGNTVQDLSVAGVKFGTTVAMDDGLKASIELELEGDPDFPT